MLRVLEKDRNALMTKVVGKVEGSDYELLKPLIRNLVDEYPKIRWYYEMEEFEGWDFGGFWKELEVDLKNALSFEKIAMVGEKDWEKWMSDFMKPFTSAKIKYFDLSEKEKAKTWIKE